MQKLLLLHVVKKPGNNGLKEKNLLLLSRLYI